jgi:hypothetical protein
MITIKYGPLQNYSPQDQAASCKFSAQQCDEKSCDTVPDIMHFFDSALCTLTTTSLVHK